METTLRDAVASCRKRQLSEEFFARSPHLEPEDEQESLRDARRRGRTIVIAESAKAVEAFRVSGETDWETPYLVGQHTPVLDPATLIDELDELVDDIDLKSFVCLLGPAVSRELENKLMDAGATVFRAFPGFWLGSEAPDEPDEAGKFIWM